MANYFPLIVNAGNSTIDELPAGDNLNLASSDIVNAGNITANYFYGNGAGLTGIIVAAGNGIVNGNSNISVTANSNILMGVSGVANVLVLSNTGAFITGTLSSTGNATVGNISTTSLELDSGSYTTTIKGNASSTGDYTLTLPANDGSSDQYLQTDGSGNLSWSTISSTSITNGNSNVVVNPNANVTISSAGNANVIVVTGTGANITGTLSVSGNANVGNIGTAILTATGNITGANLVTSGVLSVTGNANIGNIGTAILTATGNVTGANLVTGGVLSVTGNANVGNIGTAIVTATGNVTGANLVTGGVLSVTGNANIGNIGTTLITATGNVTGANLVTGGVLSVTGNANIGNIGTAIVTATGNITGANLVTGGVLSVTGNANIGNLSVSGTIAGNGSPLTALNASNISTGTVGTARLGTGTANAQTWLRGDSSWANIQTGLLVVDDIVTSASFNVLLSNAANASYTTTVTTSSTELYFNPGTGVLSATNFNSLSDQNFKTNVIRLSNASTMLNELNGYSFDWKDSVSGSSYGVIAQEVEKVLPNAVTEENGRKSVNYNAVTALLIETVKDLNQQVKDLRAEIDKLK